MPYVQINSLYPFFHYILLVKSLKTLSGFISSVFSSRLHVGTASSQLLELSGATSRQYLYLNEGDKKRYVGVKTNVKFQKLAEAFGETVQYNLLRSAQFDGQVVVVYNSVDEGMAHSLCL